MKLIVLLLICITLVGCGSSLRQETVSEREAVKLEGAEEFVGKFISEVNPLENQTIMLVLEDNGRSTIVVSSSGGNEQVRRGEWSRISQSKLQVVLSDDGKEHDEVLEFEATPEGLIATKFDKKKYGRQGFTLSKQ